MNLGKIFSGIARLFNKAFGDGLDAVRKHSQVAVNIVNTIKAIVNNPALELVTQLTKTDLDNRYLPEVKQIVDKVAGEVATAHNIVTGNGKQSDVLAAVLDHIRSLDKDAHRAFYWDFVSRINVYLSDGKVTTDEGLAMALALYNGLFQKK